MDTSGHTEDYIYSYYLQIYYLQILFMCNSHFVQFLTINFWSIISL